MTKETFDQVLPIWKGYVAGQVEADEAERRILGILERDPLVKTPTSLAWWIVVVARDLTYDAKAKTTEKVYW
jgi:hypothetical protein